MKKVLKTTGKIILKILIAVFAFLALCCIVTLIWGAVQMSKGEVTDALPKTPDDFTPTVRFAVFTDTHNENERLGNAIEKLYKFCDADEKYPGIDAIFGLGDFTSIGGEDDFDNFIAEIEKHKRKETQIINILGNHEMKNERANEIFSEKFGYDPNTVTTINGFTFIALSGSHHITEWTYPIKDLKWAAAELEKAEKTANGKPIFVMQHPHNFGTVYGSTIWCTPQTNPIWAGHSNVIDFSGHSHFPMNDPRSINQTTYTSVGVGGMARFELDKNYVVGQHPDGYDTAAQMCIVEANDTGSVRILEYDFNSDTVFNEYYIENVNDESTFAYTYKNMKAHDNAPTFAKNTDITTSVNENGEWTVSFKEASDNFIVHHYNIKITDENGKTVVKDTFINDYYVIDDDDTADFRLGTDTLSEGKKYTAFITAVSAYHKKSEEIKIEFSAAAG